MKSISFQWTPGVESWEAETVVSTIAHLQEVALVLGQRAGFSVERGQLRPFGTWVIPQLPRGSPYWSTLWYVEQSLDAENGQIVGPRYIRTFEQEPWQQAGPHYDVAILDHDLRDAPEHNIAPESDPHVFASCRPNLAAVMSVHRLRAISQASERQTALRRLAINAFGQVLELPAANRQSNVEVALGRTVCLNRCALRFAADVGQLLAFAREEHKTRTIFCAECTADLLNHVIRTHFHSN